jgi:hypothetical protein
MVLTSTPKQSNLLDGFNQGEIQMKNDLLENQGKECLLDFEDLIDPRIRENKIYNECLNTLLDEDYNPENPNINFHIRDTCITLDKVYETSTMLYREQNGTPYVNDKSKEVKIKPVEYRRLNVSLSESMKLAAIYTEKYNEKQRQYRKQALQDFSKTPNNEAFNHYMNELKNLYSFTEKDLMYFTHWITNVKRTILDKNIILPQILCFTSHKQNIGKSELARAITKVINKRVITTDLIKLSARFQPDTLTTEAVLWIDELKRIDKTISDNIKTLITSDTIDFEYKGKNGHRQYKKLASIIMSINYDPSNIFYEDEKQRRIGIIHFTGYTEKKTAEELELLIKNIWENSPIEYVIDPDTIAEITLNETKENSILEHFACQRINRLFTMNKYITATEIITNLFNYTGNRTKVLTFLKNEKYFTQSKTTGGMLLFKATDIFKSLLKELLENKVEDIDHYIYDFEKKVS